VTLAAACGLSWRLLAALLIGGVFRSFDPGTLGPVHLPLLIALLGLVEAVYLWRAEPSPPASPDRAAPTGLPG
jgi:hypothetical protein